MANPNIETLSAIKSPQSTRLATSMAYQGAGAPAAGQVTNQMKRLRRGIPYLRRGVIIQPIPQFRSVTHDTTTQSTQTGGVPKQTGGTNQTSPAFRVTVSGTRYRWPITNLPTTRT